MNCLILPKMLEHMTVATIEAIHAIPGRSLKAGDKLMDLSVDLGGAFLQACPPIGYYRLVLREPGMLRRICVSLGERHAPGAVLAEFSGALDKPDDDTVARPVRVATAGILPGPWMWSESTDR
jgi:hypothetical protein